MLVSCILPTRGRREFARLAVECFLAQDYPEKELVILDDADDLSFPDGIEHALIRYHVEPKRLYVGMKRNKCCELAQGPLICHLDSDDYSAPSRISHQVKLLQDSGKQLCSYHSILFYGPAPAQVTRYQGDKDINLGSSFLYRKEWWSRHRFTDVKQNRSEDGLFMLTAVEGKAVISVDGTAHLVARIHQGNTSQKSASSYQRMTLAALPAGFPR